MAKPRSDKVPISEDAVVERGGDKDVSTTSGKRYDPFVDPKMSAQELIDYEVKGISSLLLTSDSPRIRQIVSEAISKLDEEGIEFVTDYFFLGLPVEQIAERKNVSTSKTWALKGKVVKRLKHLLQKYEAELGLDRVYNKCVLCSCDDVKLVDEFIDEWLDKYGWKFYGIVAAVRSRFGIDVLSVGVITAHIKFHMELPYTERKLKEVPDEKCNVNAYIESVLRDDIKKLAREYGYSYSTTLRHCIKFGYIVLKHKYAMNSDLFAESELLARVKSGFG